ncbi:MAG: pentapeptide repeat-containing protein [Pseudomonadota bacterium]
MRSIVILLLVIFVGLVALVTSLSADAAGKTVINPLAPFKTAYGAFVENRLDFFQKGDRFEAGATKKDLTPITSLPLTAILTDQDLGGVEKPKGIFLAAEISRTRFVGALLDEAKFDLATGEDPDFSSARLALSTFVRANLPRADFSTADLRSMNATRSTLENATFLGSDLSGVNFTEARLSNTDFGRSRAPHGRFNLTYAVGAQFNGADLRASNFEKADLSNAVFTGADISYARFTNANLSGADFTVALGASTAWFEGACGNDNTKAPDGITLPSCEQIKEAELHHSTPTSN